MDREKIKEEFKVSGEQVVAKLRELIKEGNARLILIKNEQGDVLVEFPLTVGALGVMLAPILAAAGALAALVSSCTIVVERRE